MRSITAFLGSFDPSDRFVMLKSSIEYWRQRSEVEIIRAIQSPRKLP